MFSFSNKITPFSDLLIQSFDKAALKYVNDALKIDSNDFDGIILKSLLYLSQHHFADGLALAEKAKSNNPYNSYAYGLAVDGNVEMGNYNAAVSGTSGALSHTANVVFHVQDFTVTASPASVSVNAGVAGTATITVAPVNGFTGTVTLAVTTNSTNLSCTLSSTSIAGGS